MFIKNQVIVIYLIFYLINLVRTEDEDFECPTIVLRKKWGARASNGVDFLTIPVKYVIIHHTASSPCSTQKACSSYVKNTQQYHMNELEFWDIAYNFLIGNDGRIYEGIGWHKQGAHTYGVNSKSIGIAFIGNFNDNLPSNKAIKAAKDLLECGVKLGELDRFYRLFGARQIQSSVSPGDALYEEISEWHHWSDDTELD